MTIPVGSATSLDTLRASAAKDPKAAVREAAKQFEALFMQQLMKSMRDATLASGMLDNSGTQMGTEMLDTQLATGMTGLPGGLANAIARQLERQMGDAAAAAPVAPAASQQPAAKVSQRQADFIQAHTAAARETEAHTGIPAAFMVSQAAHETGWGRHEIRHADGSPSFNLFGMKAGPGWKGRVAEVTTTEYVNGVPRSRIARLNADGTLDVTFDPGTGFNNTVLTLALQADGRMVAGGFFTRYRDMDRSYLVRLLADGAVDEAFAIGTGANNLVRAVALQPDGKLLLGGNFTQIGGNRAPRVARLLPNGAADAR